jgi:RNA polymerase sigma factor (sigma-70 family)
VELAELNTQSREARLAIALGYCLQLWSSQTVSPSKAARRSQLSARIKSSGQPNAQLYKTDDREDIDELTDHDATFSEIPADSNQRNPLSAYLQSIRKIPHLNIEEELSLCAQFLKGDQAARDILIRSNLWLVPVIARKYAGRGVSLEDLIEEGNLALFTALDKFDPARGIRFSTYAKWWILKSATLARQRQAHAVSVPRGISSATASKNEPTLSVDEFIPELGEVDANHNDMSDSTPLANEQNCRSTRLKVETLTLDQAQAQIDEQASASVAIGFDSHIEQSAIVNQSIQTLLKAVSALPDKERLVIEHRYELNGKAQKTLQELASMCGLSAERVRKIQIEAMEKLKTHMFPEQ